MSSNGNSASDPIIGRYSALARTALAGGNIADGDPSAAATAQLGAAAHSAEHGTPDPALRASRACGNPAAVATLLPG